MSKAIKFNLLLDNYPVRDLDDLRENFNLDDLLPAYHSQVLHRWLKVRDLNNELNQLLSIKSSDNIQIAALLCKLFQPDLSDAEIKTAVYPFIFRLQQEQKLKQLAEQQFNRESVIKNYHAGYEKLCADMLEKPSDYPFLKAAVNTLLTDYAHLLHVGFNRFFDEFIEKSPLTVFAMLANESYRKSKLFNRNRKEIAFSCIPSPYIGKGKESEAIKYESNAQEQSNWESITDQKVIIKEINNLSHEITGKSVRIKDNDGKEYDINKALGTILNGLHFYGASWG